MWPWIKKTSPRRQIDPIECGAVSLGIVLAYFGKDVANHHLRRACKTSAVGSNAVAIIEASRQFGLTATAKKILAADLKQEKHLAILFFDACHFVVYEGYLFGRYYINDPARGRYTLGAEDFHKRYSGVAIILEKDSNFTKALSKKRTQFKLFSFAVEIGFYSMGVVLAIIAIFFASAVGAYITHSRLVVGIGASLFAFLFLAIFLIATMMLVTELIRRSAVDACNDEVRDLTNGLTRLPQGFFDDVDFYLFTDMPNSMHRFLRVCHDEAFRLTSATFCLSIFVFMCSLSLLLPLAVFSGWAIFIYQALMQKFLFSSTSNKQSQVNIERALSEAVDFRAMGQEEKLTERLIDDEIAYVKKRVDRSPLMVGMLSPLWPGLVFIILSTYALKSSPLELSEIYAALILGCSFFLALNNLSPPQASDALAQSLALRREINDVLLPTIVVKEFNEQKLLDMRAITFSYRGQDHALFSHIDLALNYGELIGVVGDAKTGKSTLMSLIAGKQFSSGEITHYSRTGVSLRIAPIDDDSDLMGGSIKDIITLYDKTINDVDIVKALEDAHALDIYHNRPSGLLFEILPHGKNLSLGEKKRLLLAQALVHKPDLLLLDDFFGVVAEKCSREILTNLRSKKITTLFTSSRISDLQHTDRVIFLDGKSITLDTHHNLLTSNELYQSLVGVPHEAKKARAV